MGASNITLANTITKVSGPEGEGLLGATVAAGQGLYNDPATNTLKLGQGDTAAKANFVGIAAGGGVTGQPIKYYKPGCILTTAGLTQGEVYVLSDDVAGAFMSTDDLGAGDYVSVAFVAQSATQLKIVDGGVSGVAHS